MSTSQPRDADVDRLLRAVLKPAAGGPAGVCPDPETLAAWVEGGLSLEERAGLESHFVGCGRCQEALAVIGAKAPAPRPAPARTGWFTWVAAPRLRWLVPITAAATVAVFFFATRPLIAPGDDAPASDAPVQMARVESSPEAGRMGTPADETMAAPMTEAVPVGRGAAAVIPAQAVPAATGATGSGAANEGRDRTDAAAHPAQLAASKPAAAAPGAPSAEGTARDKKEAAEAIGNVTFEAKSVVAPKPVAVAADATHPATIALQESAAPRGGGDRALFVAVPGGIVRWQFGQDGRVRRSVDGGKSWQERSLGDRVDLAAGSAPLPNVCWVVGSGGTVLLTVDGEIWQRRPFPFPLDLAAVRAADARSAVVIARDGRRFETHDGGVTWR